MHPIAHVVPAALLELLRATPLSNGKVECAWRATVGPAVQRATAVRLDGSVLIVETASAQWTREIARSSSMILGRLQNYLGKETVTSISVRERR